MDEQKRAGWAFWFTVAVLPFVGYGLMLGPACWLSSRWGGEEVVTIVYRPLTEIAARAKSRRFDASIRWYSELGAANQWHWLVFTDAVGDAKWRWEDGSWYSRLRRLSITKAAASGSKK